MHRHRKDNTGGINTYTVVTDILRNWLAVLTITLSAGMLTHMFYMSRYEPVYKTTATMVVSNKGVNNNVYENLYSASKMAGTFTQLLNSSAMQRVVAKDIGIDFFQGTAKATNVPDSNLLELSVTASTSQVSFLEMKSLLDNYRTISQDLLGNINLTLLEAPSAPEKVSNPLNTTRQVTIVMVVVFFGLIFVLSILSASRDTIRSSRDVEYKLDSSLLASINHEKKHRSIFKRIRNFRRKKSILITDPTITFRYVENIRKLTSRIQTNMKQHEAKTLMVSSVLENEGKTTIAANVALALADEGFRVLLLDADLRKPSQYKVLNIQDENALSFSDYVTGSMDLKDLENAMVTVPGSHLNCILNRKVVSRTLELFSSERVQQCIDYFRTKMDYIIIDTPPMQMVADAEEMSSVCDACVLVVRQHLVEARDINDAIDALDGDQKKLIGVIFNNEHTEGFLSEKLSYGGSYGYGYSSYGNYGDYYGKRRKK